MILPASALRALPLPALLAIAPLSSVSAAGAADAQVPGFQRHDIGTLRVTALFDGVVALPRQQLHGLAPGQVARLLDGRYVPESADGLQTAVNAYLVERDGRRLLVDAGTAQCFGDALGQVPRNLAAAGIDPASIDDVLLTHAHPDHMCGVLAADGAPAFANATLWLSAADAAWWLDPAHAADAPEMVRPAFAMAQRAAAPYAARGRLRRFSPGDALPAGVRALDSRGHTPGHVSWLIDGGADAQLLVWGDIVHYHAVQFARPEASYEADSDPAAAIASRRRLLAEAATRGWWVAGAHLPFPGLGHVRRDGDGHAWAPVEFAPVPR
ncbi:MBL fold metallo-hydrolase [Luteimonas sp. FCS-9]|uniref:MBL fold metallo-hydrolase n=1 Tax=Luteimonas sp. FCS-9 TaxID=1547516 RepID=UPI00063E9282|nr:MBL fold metallo-hydrolase [Luteimonas sp. FCS-9]KLI99899.1 beta-lactamase [Luteimonas sp. FCS-9]